LATPWGLAAHRTLLGSFTLRDSNKCFNCAKAKRQHKAPSRNGYQLLALQE